MSRSPPAHPPTTHRRLFTRRLIFEFLQMEVLDQSQTDGNSITCLESRDYLAVLGNDALGIMENRARPVEDGQPKILDEQRNELDEHWIPRRRNEDLVKFDVVLDRRTAMMQVLF